jgi:hypothetical protein
MNKNDFYKIYHADGSHLTVSTTMLNSYTVIVNADYYGSDGYYKAGLSHKFETTPEDFDRQLEYAKSTSTVKTF